MGTICSIYTENTIYVSDENYKKMFTKGNDKKSKFVIRRVKPPKYTPEDDITKVTATK